MSVDYRQAGRLLTVSSPLGEDVLLAEFLAGVEALSRPFAFRLVCAGKADDIEADELVGLPVTMTIDMGFDGGKRRYVNGLVQRLTRGETLGGGYRRYSLDIVPWFQFLAHASDHRFFSDRTVPQIISEIFDEFHYDNYNLGKLTKEYLPREYCVQYGETYFDFISRLLEEEGIFYYFMHENGSHTMTFGDSPSAYQKCEESDLILSAGNTRQSLHTWERRFDFTSGAAATRDYNFETPTHSLQSKISSKVALPGNERLSHFLYPGRFMKTPQGDEQARRTMEIEEAGHETVLASGDARSLSAGGVFTLVEHPCPSEKDSRWAITELHHNVANTPYFATGNEGVKESYHNQLMCIPHRVPFRPRRVTPKPRIDGVQTAFVIGPEGKEVHVDRYGRIKVLFHWDRHGGKDREERACWIRTTQAWAGKQWGATFVPRVGMEVVVSFIDGDPDRPIVTGCVNNAVTMPSYDLKPEETRTVLRTRSSPKGSGFNELRIEDKTGREQIFLRAQRDLHVRAKRQRREWIGTSDHLRVGTDLREHVLNDRHELVDGDRMAKVGGVSSLEVTEDVHEVVGMNFLHKSGMNVVMEAGTSISFKVGGNFITINPAGVFIKGNLVFINSGGAPAGMSASPQAPEKALHAVDSDGGQPAEPTERAKLPLPPAYRSPAVMAQARTMRAGSDGGAVACEICQNKGGRA